MKTLRLPHLCITLMLFMIIGASTNLHAQQRSFATLPLAKSDTLIVNSEQDLNHTKEYDRVLKIYNDLVNARGDFRSPVPPLYLRDEEGYVAYIDYNSGEITLEKKAYDVCAKHGDSAIAFLLAHELTHYYEKHAWRNSFVRQNSDLDIGKNLKTIQDGIINETEADYLGGFLAYTAGYGIFKNAGKVISDLYAAYGLQEELPGYPSKGDRIELCDRSAIKLQLLVDAFEMGNMLYASGKLNEAYAYYTYIMNYYPSRELYNNLGTIAVLSAMQLMEKDELKYKYVTILDLDFEGSKDASKPVKEQISDFLDQAIVHFNSAINLDPNYAPAYLNKANAFALKRDWVKADFYLNNEAKNVANRNPEKYAKMITDIGVLNGIILAEQGRTPEAQSLFQQAADQGSELGTTNLAILKGELHLENKKSEGVPLSDTPIEDQSVATFLDDPAVDKEQVISYRHLFYQLNSKTGKSRVFLNVDNNSKLWSAYVCTTDSFTGDDGKGIHLGDGKDKVISTYGSPTGVLETTQGQIYVYPSTLYYIGEDKVKQWIFYGDTIGY